MLKEINIYQKKLLLLLVAFVTSASLYAFRGLNESDPVQTTYAFPEKIVSPEDSAYFSNYRYIRLLGKGQKPEISDEEFYRNATGVIFVVSKTDINENSTAIRELVQKIIPRINADSLELDYMMIRGAASPEGPYKFNLFLGKNRCLNLFNYINSRLLFPADEARFSQSSVAEDYVGLCRMMRDAKDPQYDRVKAIVDKYVALGDYADLKIQLMAIDKGVLWKRLLKVYFPQLRSAKVMFFFRKADPKKHAKPVETFMPLGTMNPVGLTGPVMPLGPLKVAPSAVDEEPLLYRRHILALRTNLLYDFFYMPGYYWAPTPNIQAEYYPKSGHITANIGITYPHWHWWKNYQFWQIHDYMLEGRYYLKGNGEFRGLYGSAYVHANKYGIGLSKTKGWEGEGYGAGVMVGYVMNISKNRRWRLEFSLGVGFYQTKYDPYVYSDVFYKNYSGETKDDGLYYYEYYGQKANFKERNHRYTWFGPTNVGIHLTYDLLFRRIQKRGVSVNRSEKIIPENQRTQKVEIDRKGGWRWLK